MEAVKTKIERWSRRGERVWKIDDLFSINFITPVSFAKVSLFVAFNQRVTLLQKIVDCSILCTNCLAEFTRQVVDEVSNGCI